MFIWAPSILILAQPRPNFLYPYVRTNPSYSFSIFNIHPPFQKSNTKDLFYFFLFSFCRPLTAFSFIFFFFFFLFLPFSFFLYIFFSLPSHFHTHDTTLLIVGGTIVVGTTTGGITASGAITGDTTTGRQSPATPPRRCSGTSDRSWSPGRSHAPASEKEASSSSVLFWYFLFFLCATVPGLKQWGFLAPPVVGADFFAASVAKTFFKINLRVFF